MLQGTASQSARSRQTRAEGRERRQFQPRREEVEIGISGGSRPRRSTVSRQLDGQLLRITPPAQAHGQQAGGIGQSLAHEQLKPKPQLRLVGAGREVGHTAPLLTERGQPIDEIVDGGGVRVEQQSAPDAPQHRAGLFQRVAQLLRRLGEALVNLWLPKPGASVRHTRWSGNRRQSTQAHGVAQEALVLGGRLQPECAVKQVCTLGTNAQRRSLETWHGARRARPESIAPQERRELVGGRERVRSLAQRRRLERADGVLGGGERGDPLRSGHGVDRPMPIHEIRSAGGRSGEERM